MPIINPVNNVNNIPASADPFDTAKQIVSKVINLIRRIVRAIARFFTEVIPDFFNNLFAKEQTNCDNCPIHRGLRRKIADRKIRDAIIEVKDHEKELLDASMREKLAVALGTMPGSTLESEAEDLTASGLDPDQCNLFDYLSKKNLSKQLAEKKPIHFKDGAIFCVDKISEEDQINSKKIFFRLLQETYGTQLSAAVLARYDIELEGYPLTGGDVKRIMVGIAAYAKVEHLQGLFDEIKKEDPALQCVKRLLPGENTPLEQRKLYHSIKAAGRFEDLTSEHIGFLLSVFRTLPTSHGQGNIRDVLYPNLRISKTPFVDKSVVFLEDLKFLETVEQWNELRLDHYPLCISEYIGKTLAYKELKEGMVFALPDPKNKPVYYRVYRSLNKDGVVPALLVPINYKYDPNYVPSDKEDKRHLPDKENIHLVFRGTLSAEQWLKRNLDWKGVGKRTFNQICPEIMNMVTDYLKESKSKNVALFIEGHSLGGCDTQRALVSILEKIAKAPSKWKVIKHIHATTHNAPRPEYLLNRRFKKCVAALAEKGKMVPVHLTHVRFFDRRGEDFIQKWGDILIGADHDGENTSPLNRQKDKDIFHHNILRHLIDIKIPGIINPMDLHSFKPFNNKFNGQDEWKFRRNIVDIGLDNAHRKKIDKKFANRYHREEKEKPTQEEITKLGWLMASASAYAPYAGSALMKGTSFVLNHFFGIVYHSTLKIKAAKAVKAIKASELKTINAI